MDDTWKSSGLGLDIAWLDAGRTARAFVPGLDLLVWQDLKVIPNAVS